MLLIEDYYPTGTYLALTAGHHETLEEVQVPVVQAICGPLDLQAICGEGQEQASSSGQAGAGTGTSPATTLSGTRCTRRVTKTTRPRRLQKEIEQLRRMREGQRRRERTGEPIDLGAPSIKEKAIVSETIKLCERRCRSTPCNLRSSSGWQQDKRPVDIEDTIRSSPFVKRRQRTRLIEEAPPAYDEEMEDAEFLEERTAETTSPSQQQEAPADHGQGGTTTSPAATANGEPDQEPVDNLVNMQDKAPPVTVLDFEDVAEPGPAGMSTSSAAEFSRISRIVDQFIDMTTEKLVDLVNRVNILESASSKMVKHLEEFNLVHNQVQHMEKANSKLIQLTGKLQQADDLIRHLDQANSEMVEKFEEFDHLLDRQEDLEKFASDVLQQVGQSTDRLQQLEKFTNDLSAQLDQTVDRLDQVEAIQEQHNSGEQEYHTAQFGNCSLSADKNTAEFHHSTRPQWNSELGPAVANTNLAFGPQLQTSNQPAVPPVELIAGFQVQDSPCRTTLTGPWFTGQSNGHVRNVGAFGGTSAVHSDQAAMPLGNTALRAVQAGLRRPWFEGEPSRWAEFQGDWQRYAAYSLLGAPEGEMGQVLKRDLFVGCLGGLLGKRYSGEISRKPMITFEAIFKELQRTYDVEDPHAARKKWQQVHLRRNGQDISLQNWMLFETEYELAKSNVPDFTAQEEIDLILTQLPESWRTKVMKEEAKESEVRFMAKMVGAMDMSEAQLKTMIARWGIETETVEKQRGCFMVRVKTENDLNQLVAKDVLIDQVRTTFKKVRCRWISKDVFNFVGRELRIEQESRVLGGNTTAEERRPWDPQGRGYTNDRGKGKGRKGVSEVGFQGDASPNPAEHVDHTPNPPTSSATRGGRAQADAKPWAVQAFSKGISRGGPKGTSTTPSPPTTSSAHVKSGGGATSSKTPWPSTCLTCKNQGRHHEHSWRGCKFALANYELFKKSKKSGDPTTTPKQANAPPAPTGRGKGNSRY